MPEGEQQAELGARQPELGVDLDGLAQQLGRLLEGVLVKAAEHESRLGTLVEAPRVPVRGRTATRELGLRPHELGLELGGHRLRQLVLDPIQLVGGAIEASRPDVRARLRLGQLGAQAHAVAELSKAAPEHVADAELAADLAHVHGPILVDDGGLARDDEEARDPREQRDQILRETVQQVRVLGIGGGCGEGQDGDRRTIGGRGGVEHALRKVGCLGLAALEQALAKPAADRREEHAGPHRDHGDGL